MAAAGRSLAREAIQSQYAFTATPKEAFSVFGRSEVQDINRIRSCTDVPCLVAFLILLVLMAILDTNAVREGNVLRLSEPLDFQGRLCGYDKEVKQKPLGYYPNPYNDMIVCVSSCPKTGADGDFELPDGPMGKFQKRRAYPTAQIFGQHCLPLDLSLAKAIISVKSVQTEMYRALGNVFTASDVVLLILCVPLVTSTVYIVMLQFVPLPAAILAFSSTAVTLAIVGLILDLDQAVLLSIPLYRETHPVEVGMKPYFQDLCYAGAVTYFIFLFVSIRLMARAQLVFKECMAAILNKNVLIVVFTSWFISGLRIWIILHVCKRIALLISILQPVQVKLQLFGEYHYVERTAWSPYFLKGVIIYAFGAFWILEFMSFGNKYITSQVLCHNYFLLKARTEQNQELNTGKQSPLAYAIYSLFRYHLGSVAKAAVLSAPCRLLRFFIGFFVPDRPNLHKSNNPQYKIAYYLFWPLIQIDLIYLRFFKDSVWVMLPLKGYTYMEAAERVEGLLNRSRGRIPNLTKFTGKIDMFINISVGLTSMFWTFFLYREPRHGHYHQVEHISSKESVHDLLVTPAHSPLLAMPVMFAFGLWVGNGTLHLVGMASHTLTVCYCIDVEMVGGTETDAFYVPGSLKEVYKDLGGGESEREYSEMIAEQSQGGVG